MKKIISLFLITVFSLLFTTGSLAIDIQNTTNSANKTPPTPQKLIDKQIQNLKDKIATKVAELSKSNQQVLSGMISKIDKSSLSIQSKPSTKIFIDSEATAFINGINQKNKLTIDDITVSDYVVIFGLMLGDEFTAKSIIKQNQTEFIEGTIKNVEKNGYYIEIITADQETIIVDIEKNTVQKMIDEKTVQIASAGFSNYTVGARIHTVITKSDVEENRGSAVRTLLVPQQLTE